MKKQFQIYNISNMIYVVFIFALTFIFAYMLRLGIEWKINSDETTCYEMMADFFDGNYTFKGWHFSTGLFILPSTLMYLFVKIFGNTDTALYLLSSFNWALLLTCSGYCVWKMCKEKNESNWYEILFPLMHVIFLIVPQNKMFFNSGTHVLCVAASIIIYININNAIVVNNNIFKILRLSIILLLMGVLSATNTMFMYSATIPIILVGVAVILDKKDIITGIPYLLIGIATFIIHFAIKTCWILFRGEPIILDAKTVFVSIDNLWSNISAGITNTLHIFGIRPWGKELFSIDSIRSVLCSIILLKLIFEILRYFFSKDKGKEEKYIYYFLCLALTNISAYTFSTLATVYPSSNHLLFPALFGVATSGFISWMHNIKTKFEIHSLIILFGVVTICTVLMQPKLSVNKPYDEKKDVAEFLVKNGYTNGYGGFWSASTVSFFAEGFTKERDVEIMPVENGSIGRLQAKAWLTTDDILQQNGTFFVRSGWDSFPVESIVRSYGEWDEMITLEDMGIFLWKNQISTYGVFGNASYNSNMAVTDESMRTVDGSIRIRNGQSVFGPYLTLEKGKYCLVVSAKTKISVPIKIVSNDKTNLLAESKIEDGITIINISLDKKENDIEFICSGDYLKENEYIDINRIYLGKVENKHYREFIQTLSQK